MFLNPTFIPCVSAWEKVWRGGGWRWQSWLYTDEGLAESTCFLSIPEPDWLHIQVACICFMPCYLWEAHWDRVSLGTGKFCRPRRKRASSRFIPENCAQSQPHKISDLNGCGNWRVLGLQLDVQWVSLEGTTKAKAGKMSIGPDSYRKHSEYMIGWHEWRLQVCNS